MDGILEHILPANPEGRPTLIACALVATWWTTPSQRLIFSSVAIHERNSPRRMCGVVSSRSKAHLLGYVGSVLYYPHLKYQMRSLAACSGKHFPALCNLHSPTLFTIRIERISEEFHICFSAFRETLTYLSLDTFTTSFNAFVALVDYFPNITTFNCVCSRGGDGGPIPPLSRPFRGKLRVSQIEANDLGFFNRFAMLDSGYEVLIIHHPHFLETNFLESALQISTRTTKFLRLTAELHRE